VERRRHHPVRTAAREEGGVWVHSRTRWMVAGGRNILFEVLAAARCQGRQFDAGKHGVFFVEAADTFGTVIMQKVITLHTSRERRLRCRCDKCALVLGNSLSAPERRQGRVQQLLILLSLEFKGSVIVFY
jgi:hypothetical protein